MFGGSLPMLRVRSSRLRCHDLRDYPEDGSNLACVKRYNLHITLESLAVPRVQMAFHNIGSVAA